MGFMSIGMGQDAGFAEVPVARFINDMPAGFMSTMVDIFEPGILMPGICMPCMLESWPAASAASINPNEIAFTNSPLRARRRFINKSNVTRRRNQILRTNGKGVERSGGEKFAGT
jgi:hypothetical protein